MEMTGFLDRGEQAVRILRSLYHSYGYQPYKMSRFEEYDLYVQNKDFLLNDQIITFSDRNGRLLALKPDVTLSIIKNARDKANQVQKLYYDEHVYRVDKGSQDLREIMQMGLECVGDLTQLETEEVVLLALKSLNALDDSFLLDISHMGLIDAVLEESGLNKEQAKQARKFLHQKNEHEMLQLCESQGCTEAQSQLLCGLVSQWGAPGQVLSKLQSLLTSQVQHEAFAQLYHLCNVLCDQGFGERIRIDFSAGSNMKYYSGVVFTGFLEGLAKPILSGGQYDKLMQKMNHKGSAIGFAIDLNLLEQQKSAGNGFDVETVLLYGEDDDPKEVLALAQRLRENGSVQVMRKKSAELTCRNLVRFAQGEAVILEENG